MGRRIVILAVVGGMALLGFGLLVTGIVKNRDKIDREATRESLRQLGQFAASYHTAKANKKPLPEIVVVPSGTVFRPELPPDRRLSWVVPMLPFLDQRRQDMTPILALIDPAKPWDAEPNRDAARTPVRVVLSPARPAIVPADEPALTQFIGIAGLGADAAALPPDSPLAGAFRYDTPTPLAAFPDGLSNTLLFGQTNRDLGPWIRGGPATIRGMIENDKLMGEGGQFGGVHVGGGYFAFADGHVAYFRDEIDPKLLRALATRAGGEAESERVAE